jgi:hypothetical protein
LRCHDACDLATTISNRLTLLVAILDFSAAAPLSPTFVLIEHQL